MSAGPTVVQVLEGENAIARNREVMGATNPANAAEMTERDSVTGGAATPATDVSDGDQTIGETLYNEGVAEATHDQMVQSRRGELSEQAAEDDSMG